MLALCLFVSGCGVGSNYRTIPMSESEQAGTSRILSVDVDTATKIRSEIIKGHPEWDETFKAAIMQGEVVSGMSRLQVRAAWGGDLYCRQMAGGHIIDRQPRERWLYDQAPLLVMAFFADELFVTARAYDSDGNLAPIEQGLIGLRMPPRRTAPTQYGDASLLRLAQRVGPKY